MLRLVRLVETHLFPKGTGTPAVKSDMCGQHKETNGWIEISTRPHFETLELPLLFCSFISSRRRSGIGRRAGLKIQ
jgi:hypothetical protein